MAQQGSSAEKIYKEFVDRQAKYWLKELDYYGKNQFKRKLEDYPYSIGQLYDYLLNSSYNLHFKGVNDCLQHKGAEKGKLKWKGLVLFKLGFLPLQVPANLGVQYSPGQPDSPEKVRDEFYKFLKTFHRFAKEIDQKGQLTHKVSHPFFGDLNAMQWLMLVVLHFNYQLKFKKKLDKEMRSKYQENQSEVDKIDADLAS